MINNLEYICAKFYLQNWFFMIFLRTVFKFFLIFLHCNKRHSCENFLTHSPVINDFAVVVKCFMKGISEQKLVTV